MENLENITKEQLLEEVNQLKTKVAELEKSELKSRIWLENSPVCTKIVDLDFNLQYMSSSGVKELKIDDITEFYGKPYPLHFYPDSFKIPMRSNLKKAKETGKTIVQEALIVDVEGNELWYHSTIVPVNDDHGKLDYIMVVSLGTTVRVHAEKALQKSNSQLTSIIESPDNVIIFALDTNYNYLSFNQAHKKEMKYVYDANIEMGKPILSYVNNENDRIKSVKNYKRVLSGKRFLEIQQYGIGEDRSWYELIFNPIFDDSNQVTGFTAFVTNITDRKRVEEELLKHRKHLEQLVKERTAEVDEKNQKLSDQMKVFVGREQKIRDLEMRLRAIEGE